MPPIIELPCIGYKYVYDVCEIKTMFCYACLQLVTGTAMPTTIAVKDVVHRRHSWVVQTSPLGHHRLVAGSILKYLAQVLATTHRLQVPAVIPMLRS